jgi:uncharacterized membrane protein
MLGAVVAALMIAAGGPVRVAGGLALCLYLPGRLAVLALLPGRGPDDRYLKAALVPALSLCVTMLAGLVLAATRVRLDALSVPVALLVACAGLATVGAVRVRRRGAADPGGPPRGWRPPRKYLLAAAPVVLLTLALLLGIIATTRSPHGSDASFSEFALGRDSGSQPTVTVRSHERQATRYRYEVRVNGNVVGTVAFELNPGQRKVVPVDTRMTGRVELRLYRADSSAPYQVLLPR